MAVKGSFLTIVSYYYCITNKKYTAVTLKRIIYPVILMAMALASCSTPKNITYFQHGDVDTVLNVSPQQVDIRVRPGDKLLIIVGAEEPALAAPFNLTMIQNRLGNTTTSTVNTDQTLATQSYQSSYYTVDSKGDIKFPVLGVLHVAGLKREEVAAYICGELQSKGLIKDPVVTVEFLGMGVNIIGEVYAPGHYEFNKDRLTILDALAMAKDLKPNGLRENVKLIREIAPGKQQIYFLDLTDLVALTQSPAFYVQQGDVIYVEPNDKSKRETTSTGTTPFTPSFWVSVGSVAVTVATLIVTITR